MGGVVVGLAGVSLVGVGLWARREVVRTLRRERIVSTASAKPPNAPVVSGPAARSMAEIIRSNTLAAAGGRPYAETEEFIDVDGNPTSNADAALKDAGTGKPVENPTHALWLQSTTLQTALMQAYVATRLADLTVALGGTLLVTGAGITAAGAARG